MITKIERVSAYRVEVPYVIVRIIARGIETHARMVQVELSAGGHTGFGQAHPTLRYNETEQTILADVDAIRPCLAQGVSREALLTRMNPGPARNAVDCALWDLECKLLDRTAEAIAGLEPMKPVTTVYTLSLKSPDAMAALAAQERDRPFLKVKLGHFDDDRARLEAVRRAAPRARLIVDANEGWSLDQLREMAQVAADCDVVMLEQPMHATRDEVLGGFQSPVPLGADESCHTRADLRRVRERGYATVNIKLDKSGGLTEALALAVEARDMGFDVMVGCMSGTTLAMAPGYLVAQRCRYVDLDSPIYLPPETAPEIQYKGSEIIWAPPRRWGRETLAS